MKNYISLIRNAALLLVAPLMATGCSDSTPAAKPSEVTLSIDVKTRANITNSLDDANTLSVFSSLYTSRQLTSSARIEFTRQGTVWRASSSSLMLEPEQYAELLAVYPATGATSAEAISVSLAQQQDVLFGEKAKSTYEQPDVRITMNHALCLFSFNILRESGSPSTQITSISLLDAPSQGTLQLSTGTVTASHTGDYTLKTTKALSEKGWSNDLPSIFALPVLTEKAKISVQTDQGKFSCDLPVESYQQGYQYIFHLALTNRGLTLFKNDTQKVSLNQQEDAMQVGAYGVLQITHTSNPFTVPTFGASASFAANILWGDSSSEGYAEGATHTYATTGAQTVTIESWGAESVTLPTLADVEEIDFSQF